MVMSPLLTFSQSSDAFSYQSVLRDASGNIISNRNVLVEVSILSSQSLVYSESHNTSTSSNGIISLKIGSKNQSSFSNIDWSNNNHSIRVKVSLDGSDYYVTTESDLLSVPYALYAKESADSPQLISSIAKVQADVDQNELDADAAIAALQTDVDGNESDADAAIAALQSQVDAKQDVLTAGSGISISGGIIASTASAGAEKLSDLSDVSTYLNGVWINGGSSPETNSKGSNTNVAVGINALDSASNVDDTVAIGYNALTSSSTGLRSVAVGHSALKNSNANNNVAVGMSAGSNLETGNNNVLLGYNAQAGSTSARGQIVIGPSAVGVDGDNIVTIGNANVSKVYMAQDQGATVYLKGIAFADGTTQTTAPPVSSSPTFATSMVGTDSATAAADSEIDLPGLNFRYNSDTHKLEVRGDAGDNPQAGIFYFSWHRGSNDTENFRPDVFSTSSSQWNPVDNSRGTTLPLIDGAYRKYVFDFTGYPINKNGNHVGRTWKVELLLGGWGYVHMKGSYY